MNEPSTALSASRGLSTTEANMDTPLSQVSAEGEARDLGGLPKTDDKGVLDEKSTGLVAVIMLALCVSELL